MDKLQRKLLFVEGKCYRYYDKALCTENEKLEENNVVNESDIIDVELEEDKNSTQSQFKHSFYVHRDFVGLIIGKGGKRMREIKEYSQISDVCMPPKRDYGPITLKGSCGRDIVLTKHKIDQIVNETNHRNDFTHVIDFPIKSEEVNNKFNEFRTKVLKDYADDSVDLSVFFQIDTKLHIKTKVLWLEDDLMKEQAVLALHACEQDIIKPFLEKNGPLTIEISGIECEQDDTQEAKDLYAKIVDEKGHLLALSQKIIDYFAERGLMRRNKYKKITKLRMAIMKTKFLMYKMIYAKQDTEEKDGLELTRKITFDATKIIEKHEDTYFGKITLSSIHLSIRRYVDNFDGYKFAAKIDF